MSKAKPFCISKWEVWEAYKRVKANKGAAGVDEQTIEDFEKKLKKNLYKIWNRMSSGSYFPPPVRTVKIPKASGGERKLGIPTVADRIAQSVVKSKLEPQVEPLFHPNSFGYRPGRSALDAVGQARRKCWDYDWVLDLDVRGWLQYYGRFYRSAVYRSLRQLDKALARWASQKFKRLRRQRSAHQWVARLSRRAPALFAHWQTVKGGSVVGAV